MICLISLMCFAESKVGIVNSSLEKHINNVRIELYVQFLCNHQNFELTNGHCLLGERKIDLVNILHETWADFNQTRAIFHFRY